MSLVIDQIRIVFCETGCGCVFVNFVYYLLVYFVEDLVYFDGKPAY